MADGEGATDSRASLGWGRIFGPADDTPSIVVNKADVRRGGRVSLPRYVWEFLIAEATSPKARKVNYQNIFDTINAANRAPWKSMLMREGKGILIGAMSIVAKPEKDAHVVRAEQFADLKSCAVQTNLNMK